MQVTQVYSLLNTVTSELIGDSALVKEDLSNVLDVGKTILNNNNVDNYVKTLINRIGKTIFVDRKYAGIVPDLLMDSWEFGSVMQKISCAMPDAVENKSFALTDGTDYSPNVFYKPTVTQKLFNSKVTFEVNLSFTDKQVRESFDNADQLNAFYSMLYTAVENSLTLKIDSLAMRSVSNMIAETLHDDYGSADLDASSHIKAVNLLYLYNQTLDTPITVSECLNNEYFLKFATYTINNYADRLKVASKLFNIGGNTTFTTADNLKILLLSDFVNSCDVYLKSKTYNDSLVSLPKSIHVPYWQGSGFDYGFDSISKIHVKTTSGDEIETTGILGVMFDRNGVAICNSDIRVTTNYNPRAEFYTNFYKYDCMYINDFNENFVVFFVA